MLVPSVRVSSHRGLSLIDEAELGGVLAPLHLLQVQEGFSRVGGHAGGLEEGLGKGIRLGCELRLGPEVETGLWVLAVGS